MMDSPDQKRRLSLRPEKRSAEPADLPAWRVLVVDDDPQIHVMTELLLRDFSFQDRGFKCVSAHSAEQARQILAADPEIPVVLLDVVMETDDAGLSLARDIRRRLNNHRIRIILRTGYPGEAPERDVMLSYDINDYRAKTELTAQKLFTALVAALRAWTDIDTIERLNATLEARVAQRTLELAESRAFSDSLIEMLPHPLWVKDVAGCFRRYNRAFREFFGINPQEWVGRSAEEMLGAHLPKDDLIGDCRLLDGSSLREEFEMSLPDSTGTFRSLMVAKAPLHLDGGKNGAEDDCGKLAGGIIAAATDITERKRLENELRRLAATDPLTGCANRRAFTIAACREMERSLRYETPLSVIMLDLDHFKRVNDAWGHAIGDELLIAVAQAAREHLREIDVLARMGGEEFAVLLPQTDMIGAAMTAERLRAAIDHIRIALPDGALRATISLGVAERLPAESVFDHLLSRADRALYDAKTKGRNQVVQASV